MLLMMIQQCHYLIFGFPLLSAILLIVFNINLNSAVPTAFLKGNKIPCNEEGQIVVIPFLRADPCITCMCMNNEIDCFKNTCPQSLNCYYYHSNHSNNDNCCHKCLSCSIGDRIVNNGEFIQDSKDICKSYYCNSGTLTSFQTECHVPCDRPIKIMGQCCPSCSACPNNARDGDVITMDKCVRCYCFNGQMICHRKICPVLSCHKSEWFKPPHSCCPMCKGKKMLDNQLTNGDCLIGDQKHKHMEQFTIDECTTCTCQNSTNICHRKNCPKLSCPKNEQFKPDGQCCSLCQAQRIRKGMNFDCQYQNRNIKNGDWTDSCKQCKCVLGKIECNNYLCPHDFVCPFGYRKVRLNGECCESCVPEDGRCIVTDMFQNITTYDGRNYHWNGHCNYILTRDCTSKQFSIHLLNKFHNSSTPTAPIYRGVSISVKIEHTKIFLSHLGRIRVNRTLVPLPYIQFGQFSIMQTQDGVVKLHSIIGIDISWQRNKSIEIKIKNQFRDLTCGLCGNYNLDPDDEFQSKNHRQLDKLDQFVNTFKIGQNVVCPKLSPPISLSKSHAQKTLQRQSPITQEHLKTANKNSIKICRQFGEETINFAIRFCNKIKRRYRSFCPDTIDDFEFEQIFEQCLENVCTCRGNKQCYCYTIEHFINNCKKINKKIRNDNGTSTIVPIFETPMCQSLKCPPGSEYLFCSYDCRKVCPKQGRREKTMLRRKNNLSIIENGHNNCRRKECRSGCECIGNRVWYQGKCLPEVVCPYQ